MMSNKLYDALKFCALILFPAFGTLYFTLAGVWGLPNPEGVVGTVVAVDTFLGVILGLSTNSYNKSDEKYDGDVVIVHGAEDSTLRVGVNDPPSLVGKKEVVLKVLSEAPPDI